MSDIKIEETSVAVPLNLYIDLNHKGVSAALARSESVEPQQITKWKRKKYIVVDGVLYSPMRTLK